MQDDQSLVVSDSPSCPFFRPRGRIKTTEGIWLFSITPTASDQFVGYRLNSPIVAEPRQPVSFGRVRFCRLLGCFWAAWNDPACRSTIRIIGSYQAVSFSTWVAAGGQGISRMVPSWERAHRCLPFEWEFQEVDHLLCLFFPSRIELLHVHVHSLDPFFFTDERWNVSWFIYVWHLFLGDYIVNCWLRVFVLS